MSRQAAATLARREWMFIPILVILYGFLYPMADRQPIKFEHLSLKDGLSQSTVHTIIQDHQGFIWFGTEDGLNRYDGNEFRIFRHDTEDNSSLSSNKIQVLYEDRHGILWVGTDRGLNRFNRESEVFFRYEKKTGNPESPKDGDANLNDTNFLNDDYIVCLYQDKDGVIWIGTRYGGVSLLDPVRKGFTHYNSSNQSGLKSDAVQEICQDKSGVIWLGTQKDGLARFDRKSKTFSYFQKSNNMPHSICSNKITDLYEDRSGNFWIGTKNGLNRMDRTTRKFTHFKHEPGRPESLSHDYIYNIYEDRDGQLWFGTYAAGLNRWNPLDEDFTRIRHRAGDPESLSNDYIHAIYQDRGGVFWIGTDSGINKWAPGKKKFACWRPGSGNSDSNNYIAASRDVWSIYKDKQGDVWFGTTNGLHRWNRNTDKHKVYRHDPQDPDTISHDRVMAIHKDSDGFFWFGTYANGLNRFDPRTGKFQRFLHLNGDVSELSEPRVYSICEDKNGQLWFGTHNGLNRLDKKTDRFSRWQHDPDKRDSLSDNSVFHLHEDRRGVLWIATGNGLNRWNPEYGNFTSWKRTSGNPGSLSDDYISYIYEDKAGNLWIGTTGGLNLFDREKGTFSHFTSKNGLPSDTVYGILEDENGCLWLSSTGGIARFDPLQKTFRVFDTADGIQSNEFHGSSCCRGSDGEMFFGGINGFNYFYPYNIKDNPNEPIIVITDFQLLNKTVPIGPAGNGILEKSVTQTTRIVLSHEDYYFSFRFAALDYYAPEKNQYEYKMENFDTDWIKTTAKQRFAPFTKLLPGDYVFRVRGSNNDGLWNEKGAAIRITITPPYWQTWWFRGLIILAFIFVLFAWYRHRTRLFRQKLTDEKRVQDILRRSRDEAEFRHAEVEKLIAAISAILIAVDTEGRIFRWNQSAEKFFGIFAPQSSQRSFVGLLKEFIGEKKLEEIMEMGLGEAHKKPTRNVEIAVESPGKERPRLLMVAVNPILDRSGKRLGFLLLAEDITRRKEEERQQILSQKLESLGHMASNIAHEIKTPLQYIGHNGEFVCNSCSDFIKFFEVIREASGQLEKSGNTEWAEKVHQAIEEYDIEYILQEVPKASDQIVGGVTRVSNIIKSMKEFSHPGRGVLEKADVNQLIQSTLVIVKEDNKKDVSFELQLDNELPQINCYPAELSQVFMNLMLNAVDSIREKGEHGNIVINTGRENGEMKISIRDNGRGIPEKFRDKVFNPFFTTKGVGKGTGKGLALAHRIIFEHHKGKLCFKSKAGEGTTFYIHLPLGGDKGTGTKDEENSIC